MSQITIKLFALQSNMNCFGKAHDIEGIVDPKQYNMVPKSIYLQIKF